MAFKYNKRDGIRWCKRHKAYEVSLFVGGQRIVLDYIRDRYKAIRCRQEYKESLKAV